MLRARRELVTAVLRGNLSTSKKRRNSGDVIPTLACRISSAIDIVPSKSFQSLRSMFWQNPPSIMVPQGIVVLIGGAAMFFLERDGRIMA